MRYFKLLLDGAPAEGNGPVAAEPPPAAVIVTTGTVSERETNIAAELAAERESHASTANEKKAREVRIAELEDQLRIARGEVTPKPKKSVMQSFLDGDEI